MKKTIIHFIFALAFVSGLAMLTSCGGSSEGDHTQTEEQTEGHDHGAEDHDHGDAEEEVDQTGPEYTSAYVCPMHCEGSGSDEPGKCPVCGMDYIANEDGGEAHDDEGHDHH